MKPKITKNKYCEIISNILEIPLPNLIYNDTELSGTQLARISIDEENKTTDIYLRENYESPLDFYFTIAHELRHLWQMNSPDIENLYEQYKPSDELTLEEYNDQFLETDANAFAVLIFEVLLGIGINIDILNSVAVNKRKDEIITELVKTGKIAGNKKKKDTN